jgi:endonuclease/exonuclease/phosphatase family metal-dependent hydrolase
MRVVTLNTWKNDGDYLRRLPLMRDGLAALGPDIVCLQECFVGGGEDTAAWLAAELGLALHAAPARAKPRPHLGADVESTSGLAILTRFQGATSAVSPLVSHPADGERIAQRLDCAVDGWPLRILNLHLTHLRGDRGADLRAEQFVQALAWAEQGLEGGLIVAGDLNARARDPALAPIASLPGLAGPTLIGPRGEDVRETDEAIDHCVLLRPGAWRAAPPIRALDQADTEGWHPSDHAAVVVDLHPI